MESQPGRRLLFCSYHGFPDTSSGASLSMRDLLSILSRRGWACRALCGPLLDYDEPRRITDEWETQGLCHATLSRDGGGEAEFKLRATSTDRMPVVAFDTQDLAKPPEIEKAYPFAALVQAIITRDRPDVVLTYGGSWTGRCVIAVAKSLGVPVVFWLRNFAYTDPAIFEPVDAAIVPGEHAREHYLSQLGMNCHALPPPVDLERVRCASVEPRYLTLVNPDPNKGVYYFAGIAQELARRRPDIPLLVVPGRAGSGWLRRAMNVVPENAYLADHVADPRAFYGVTRAVLMPSLWRENVARVPREAMINGIPVLASTRGGLPESLAGTGFLFDIAERYTPQATLVPTPAEVEPWVKVVERLWDDDPFYSAQRAKCLQAAAGFGEGAVASHYERLLDEVIREGQRAADAACFPLISETVGAFLPPAARDDLARLCNGEADALLRRLAQVAPSATEFRPPTPPVIRRLSDVQPE